MGALALLPVQTHSCQNIWGEHGIMTLAGQSVILLRVLCGKSPSSHHHRHHYCWTGIFMVTILLLGSVYLKGQPFSEIIFTMRNLGWRWEISFDEIWGCAINSWVVAAPLCRRQQHDSVVAQRNWSDTPATGSSSAIAEPFFLSPRKLWQPIWHPFIDLI